jgi:hypothetical protein
MSDPKQNPNPNPNAQKPPAKPPAPAMVSKKPEAAALPTVKVRVHPDKIGKYTRKVDGENGRKVAVSPAADEVFEVSASHYQQMRDILVRA